MGKEEKINISNITPDDNICVTALMDNKKLELPVQYANLSEEQSQLIHRIYGDKILPLELIVKEVNGEAHTVSFDSKNSILQFVVVNKQGVFKWDNIKVKKHSFQDGKSIHIITAVNPEGKKHNRRRGVRVSIDTRMTIEQNDVKYIVLVRDISYCGFSFINLSPDEFDPNMPFLLHLTERDGDKSFLVGKFVGKVLRQQEQENSPTIYGCMLSGKHAGKLQKYVALKQVEFLSGKKQYAEIRKTSTSEDWKAEVAEALSESDTEQDTD